MIYSGMGNPCDMTLLALTALERWAATRNVQPRAVQEYTTILAIGLLVLALLVLLGWISHRRTHVPPVPARDLFSDAAARRELGLRERRLLLAIVARSGLRRSHDIFITPDAFDRGAAKLLAECARSRTAQEYARLRAEVAGLREKLAYRVKGKRGQVTVESSQDIPLGAMVELQRKGDPEDLALEAVVVRNDDLEIAVEARVPVTSTAGEAWRVRCHLNGGAWEFETLAVSGEGHRLILNHGGQLRAVPRDRPGRAILHAPATVARFPLIQAAATEPTDMTPTDWFEPVRGVVTEMSGTSLQIRSSLQVRVGERVLVVFALWPAPAGETTNGADRRGHIVAHAGRVTRSQAKGDETAITVDLTDLQNREIDELVRLTRAAASGASEPVHAQATQGA
ncbi:MAG: hypothetical protein JW955_01415 [Sedimentisphaerales bacterium]|nr:hypothetical protein [Sedimentisphaerales bacterium]